MSKIRRHKLRKFKDDTTQAWYLAGLIFAVLIVIAIVVFIIWGEKLTHLPGSCVFVWATGLYCPGCGGTRSFNALVHGKIWQSILFNPFVPYTIGVYVFFMINTLLVKKTRKLGFEGFPVTIMVYVGMGLLLAQCVIRNILFKCYGITCL